MTAVLTMPQFITQPTRSPSGDLGEFYRENGYVVIPNALSAAEVIAPS